MSDMPERIWAVIEDVPGYGEETFWWPTPNHDGTEYIRADLHEAQQERIQFLEKALGQALMYEQWVYSDERRCPELAEYLKEKKENA